MKIAVIIVTYNRLDLLKKTLDQFGVQSVSPDYLIVVNNASSDGTDEYLELWEKGDSNFEKIVVTNSENLGGSGGFYSGFEKAMELPVDWIWVSDDDAIPEKNAIEMAIKGVEMLNRKNIHPVAICGTVINDNEIDTDHRRNLKKGLFTVKNVPVPKSEYVKDYFKLDEFSYIGSLINKKALESVGITDSSFFICYDDTEHSLRLGKKGDIYCIPSVKLHHDVGARYDTFKWSTYYAIRNK